MRGCFNSILAKNAAETRDGGRDAAVPKKQPCAVYGVTAGRIRVIVTDAELLRPSLLVTVTVKV